MRIDKYHWMYTYLLKVVYIDGDG